MTRKSKSKTAGNTPLPDDFELWHTVTRTVEPLKDQPRRYQAADPGSKTEPGQKSSSPPKSPKRNSVKHRPIAPAVHAPAAPAPVAMPMTGLDRRTRQKFVRGSVEVDARLDLHGMGRQDARSALRGFILRARKSGHRTVLVITGKGRAPVARHTLHGYNYVDMPEREGVLRRALPQWLEEPEFRVMVSGYQPAHPRHGGGGAFYVRLRKPRRV